MKKIIETIRKAEFEARIFISLGIILCVCLVSFLAFPETPNNMVLIGRWLGWSPRLSYGAGFGLMALLMFLATTLRMWSGTVLSSPRVMSFRIQKAVLLTEGPYKFTRNPIYLADLSCMLGFAFCLTPVGIAIPVLFLIHYTQLILYEEKNLKAEFGEAFEAYKKQTPRLVPYPWHIPRIWEAVKEFRINRDGFRHNGQYLLLIPGFIVSAFTGNVLHAILIGLPSVIDWAVVHTRIGLNPDADWTRSKVFRDILYANCWEDPQIDRKAFQSGPGDVIFSITSGGCNTLAFLADSPEKVYALDLSPCQNYLLELKMAAFRELEYAELLEFLGIHPSGRRLEMYGRLLENLSPESIGYWNKNRDKIKKGLIHCGRYEGYMRLLKAGLKLLVGRSLPETLFACKTAEEREIFFEKKWNNSRYRFFTRVFLSRTMMSLLFTGKFFRQLEESFSFGDHFRGKVKRAVTTLPLRENYFLAYILLGKYYGPEYLPVYLRKENHEKIKTGISRIELITGDCLSFFKGLPAGSISRFNFSNIFEWMDPESVKKLLQETVRVARNGAVLTYRNLLVPRSRPQELAGWIEPDKALASTLLGEDLSFIYRNYIVERITKTQ